MDLSVIARFGILLVRPGALILTGPGLGGQDVPAMARVALTVFLALALAPLVTFPTGPNIGVFTTVFREAMIGLTIGFAARALIVGVEMAGHLCSQQIGFSYASTINPVSGTKNTVVTTLYGMLAMFVWFSIGGHHLLIRALHASYEGLPIGSGELNASLVQSVRDVLGLVFTVAVRLSAPIVAVLLIVEVAVGLISRSAPALNFDILGYPTRLIVGLAVAAATVVTVPGVIRALAERVIALGLEMAAAFQ
jgi:flagellar biosynthesis protein FliR